MSLYSEQRKYSKNQQKQTLAFSDNLEESMFQPQPFLVQSKSDRLHQPKQDDLETSLMQAERYGHNLSKINSASIPDTQIVQPKLRMGNLPGSMPKLDVNSPKIQSVNTLNTGEVIQTARTRKPQTRKSRTRTPQRITQSGRISKTPRKKRTTTTDDEAAKNKLGHVPGTFLLPEKPKDYVGTYEGQREKYKKTPSGNKVEADHMTPDSLHQPLGQKRKTSDGTALSKRLPAAQLPYELHRRKNTTGSGKEVEHQRAYLLHAHHGQVPFAGPMGTPKEHYAAAMEIDLRNTFDDRTVFGKPNSLDPRTFPPTHKQGMAIPFEDMAWSADRIKEMLHESNRQERISSEGKTHLYSVVEEQLGALKGQYPKPK
ncbi:MAG: hypothetical protein V7K48_20715 [Nostoc sp.]|uniref:hypothetical protein n=1 Tax=Nostoc sp. TaxID=1180 RepID=UPI002FF98274